MRRLVAAAILVSGASTIPAAPALAQGSTAPFTLSVADQISVDATNISSNAPATISGPVANFTDSNRSRPLSVFSATVSWGDGSDSAGLVTGGSGIFTVSANHSYNQPGTYQLIVTVHESGDGQSATGQAIVRIAGPPNASITSPANNQSYLLGQSVTTAFTCREGTAGPGLASCDDSNGVHTTAGGSGHLDTSTTGSRTYTVTATSIDGQSSIAALHYTVYQPAKCSATGSLTVSSGQYMAITCTVNVNVDVQAGGYLWLKGGTINGNAAVDSGASFTATGGTVQGDIQSQGALDLNGLGVGGNLTVSGGTLQDESSSISGNLVVNPATWIAANGGTVDGNVQVQGLTGVPPATVSTAIPPADFLCGAIVDGGVQFSGNGAGAVIEIGAAPDCPTPLQIGESLQVQNNGGPVVIGRAGNGAGNSAMGNILVSGNSGGGTLTGNRAGKNCRLNGNNPPIQGSGNTAGAGNNCNGSG